MIELASTGSMRVSLETVRIGKAELNERRASMLRRVSETGDWAKFKRGHLELIDLAYLTAKTGHEFAILRGKREDILFHGDVRHCGLDGILIDMLVEKKLSIVGHSHPGEPIPMPSNEDRKTLEEIGQRTSWVVSGITGAMVKFSADPFEVF